MKFRLVEEFTRYKEDSGLYDILQDYENQGQLEENYQNSELSGEYDSEGNELTKAQVKFFKDSKARDKNGRLLVCYHGSSAEFDIFEESRIKTGTFGNGFYFTTNKKSATRYGKAKGYYLNIKNMIEIPVKYENIIEFVIDKYNGNDNINTKESTQIIKENGYDGIMTKMYYGDDNFEYYIAFYPNQIKSIYNKEPSSSNNINENMLNESKADTEKFRQWLLNVETNTSKAKDLFDWFEQNRKNLKSPQNDYYYWIKQSNSQDAINELTELTIKGKDRKAKKETEKEGANLIYKDNEWYVYKITNYEASCKIGANTKWCITGTKRWGTGDADGKKYWDEYAEKGITMYFFIDRKNNTKYAIAVYPNKTFEIYDEEDLEISFIPNAPQIKEIGVNYWDRDDKRLLQYLLMGNKLPKQFTLEMFENLLRDKTGKYEQDAIITLTDNKETVIGLLEEYIPDGYIEYESADNNLLTPEEYEQITGMEYDYDWGWDGDMPPFDFATLSEIQNDCKTKKEICSIENPFIKNNKYWLIIDTYEVKFDGFDSYERLIRDGIFPYADTDTFKEFLDVCSDAILQELKKQKNKKYIEDIVKLGVSQQYLTGKINENLLHESTNIYYMPYGRKKVEIIQNPTDKEYRELIKEQRELYPNIPIYEPVIRYTFGEFGNEYIWAANDCEHWTVERWIYKTLRERTNQGKNFELFDEEHSDLID